MLDETAKSDSAAKSDAKSATGGSDSAPANYSRGEGQKLVTRAYRENWLAIFGKPARKSPKRVTKPPKRKPAAKTKKAAAKAKSKTRSTRRR